MIYKENYWPTKKDMGIVRLAQKYQLYVLPEMREFNDDNGKKFKELCLIIRHKGEALIESDHFTTNNIGHATYVMYDKYYRKLFKYKSILAEEEEVKEEIIEKKVNINPLHGQQNKFFT